MELLAYRGMRLVVLKALVMVEREFQMRSVPHTSTIFFRRAKIFAPTFFRKGYSEPSAARLSSAVDVTATQAVHHATILSKHELRGVPEHYQPFLPAIVNLTDLISELPRFVLRVLPAFAACVVPPAVVADAA